MSQKQDGIGEQDAPGNAGLRSGCMLESLSRRA